MAILKTKRAATLFDVLEGIHRKLKLLGLLGPEDSKYTCVD